MNEKELAVQKDVLRSRKPKVLYIDIETSYAVGTFWGHRVFKTDIIEVLQPPLPIMVGWMWHGEKKAHSVCLADFKGYKPGIFNINDRHVVEKAWELLDEADVVIGQNSDKFDIRMLNARFWHYGMGSPSGFGTEDTLKRAKKSFYLPSYKLKELLKYRKLPQKKDPGGIGGWDRPIREGKDWDKMGIYCRNDVEVLAPLFESMASFGKQKNLAGIYTRRPMHCQNVTCMSTDFHSRGTKRFKSGWKRAYQCQKCGTWWLGELEKEKPALDITMV